MSPARVLLALATMLTASAASAASAGVADLSLAVSDGPVSLPVYVAQARGFFDAAGLRLQERACRSGRECYRMMLDGRADVATGAELLVATGQAARPDVTIIATIDASSYQIKIVGRRSAGLVEEPQIRGKRVGTVQGSSAQYFLDNWLVFNDIDPGKITRVPLTPDRVVAALRNREVDAVAIWEPLASAAALALDGDSTTFESPRVYTQHFNLLTTRATIARSEPLLLKLLAALIRAQRFIAEQPLAARDLLAARLHVEPALAGRLMAAQDYRVRLDQSLVNTLESEARWAARADGRASAAAGRVDLLRAIDPSLLGQVAPDAVGLVR